MSYDARVLRIVIASPSDVQTEREIIARTILKWNDEHSINLNTVLLPVRWETHSSPEYGRHPQDVLNDQLIDSCDILIGVFWTRLGTPTNDHTSGTVEEIERFHNAGKPVMLYFSNAKQSPADIDIEQLQALREFRKAVEKRALIEEFSDQVELRDKIVKHIAHQSKQLIASESGDSERLPCEILLTFADMATSAPIGGQLELRPEHLTVIGYDEIIDYEGDPEADEDDIPFDTPNKDYYRDVLNYQKLRSLYQPIRFHLINHGYRGARDVYIELHIYADASDFDVLTRRQLEVRTPSKNSSRYGFRYIEPPSFISIDKNDKNESSFSGRFEMQALQPMREVSPEWSIAIAASVECKCLIHAKIFADSLSEPMEQSLFVDIKPVTREIHVDKNLRKTSGQQNQRLSGIQGRADKKLLANKDEIPF